MRFQLNSPMHDLCLRDCFLLQSEVLKTPPCIFFSLFFFFPCRPPAPYAGSAWASHGKQALHHMAAWHLGVVAVLSRQIGNYEAPTARTRGAFIAKIGHVHLYFLCANGVCVEMSSLQFLFLFFSDLENFKTQRRNAVRVREGQGVVLLCGPPPHSGGKSVCSCLSLLFVYLSCRCLSSLTHLCFTYLSPLKRRRQFAAECGTLDGPYHFPYSSSSPYLSGQLEVCVCVLPSDLLTVCLHCGGQRSESFLLWDTRGLSAWFPVGDPAKLWHADWGGCLRLGLGQAE